MFYANETYFASVQKLNSIFFLVYENATQLSMASVFYQVVTPL